MQKLSRSKFMQEVTGYPLSLLGAGEEGMTPEEMESYLEEWYPDVVALKSRGTGIVSGNRYGILRKDPKTGEVFSRHFWAIGDSVYKEKKLYFVYTQGRLIVYRKERKDWKGEE